MIDVVLYCIVNTFVANLYDLRELRLLAERETIKGPWPSMFSELKVVLLKTQVKDAPDAYCIMHKVDRIYAWV